MDPRLLFVVLFIALRVFGVVNRNRKRRQSNGSEMADMSGESSNPMNPMNRRPKVFHKRDREDPFDGMNGDVTQAKLTMDDIVTK